MMPGDCQSQGLAEWLQSMGWSENLSPSDLRELNAPRMRSIWRHLQAHVTPTHIACTIRKNVLLARLEKENIFVGHFGNFKLDSVDKLSKVKEILKIEEEKVKVKEDIKMMDKKLQNKSCELLKKNTEIEWKRNKLNEIEGKTMILEMKNAKLVKDIKKIKLDQEMAINLQISKMSISHNERNNQKLIVSKYIKNYPGNDGDGEYMCEMMGSIFDFKPDSIFDGILQVVKEALNSLDPKVDVSENKEGKISSKKAITFHEKLRHLKGLMIRNKQTIEECISELESKSKELQDEKKKLVKPFLGLCVHWHNRPGTHSDEYGPELLLIEDKNGSSINVNKVLDDVLHKIGENRTNDKMLEMMNNMLPDDTFESVQELKRSVISLSTKDNELWGEVEKKMNEINILTCAVFYSILDSVELKEIFREIRQLASDFKTETSEMNKNSSISTEFTDMILKEIEVLQEIPMVALQRKWDTSNSMLRNFSSSKTSYNPSLLQFLLQSEEKNLIVNVLEKYLWSLHISPQLY